MRSVFVVFGNTNCHTSVKQILSGAKGSFSLFIENGSPVSGIEEVLRTTDARAEYKVSQTQTGMNYSRNGVLIPELLLSEIANAATDNALFVLDEQNCKDFVPVLKESVGMTSGNGNHFTCNVAPTKFAAVQSAYATA